MSETVISVENLGKKYRLGGMRHDTLRDRLVHAFKAPFRRAAANAGDASEFWALRDVSFEVKRGEVLGVIGRNGAGKSTLLKILSRITEPTTGRISIRGRVASLLEVGTGFHPELSGRENIFLNGAILGMSREEIRRKFDEIVAFAEVERFLDTPVKHYSSGMYVRLAFAVAAHLEPEILIVDEVLAVGDVQFQQKCMGRMRTIAKEEKRTVLFVSHNMAAVSTLTTNTVVLTSGQLAIHADTTTAIKTYYASLQSARGGQRVFEGRGAHSRILAAELRDAMSRPVHDYSPGEPLCVAMTIETDGRPGLSLEVLLSDPAEQRVGIFSLCQLQGAYIPAKPGVYECLVELDGLLLAAGTYSIDILTSVANVAWDHRVDRAVTFEVHTSNPGGTSWDFRYAMGFGPLALRAAQPPAFTRRSG